MVIVPAGTAVLGAGANDPLDNADERPERRFQIARPFMVGRYEVTRAEFEAFARATNRAALGNCLTDRRHPGDWQLDAATTFRDPGFAQAGNHPVACVSWDDAQAYIDWLNSMTSGGYRLLTEVEWEYIARAGSLQNYVFPWGDNSAEACDFANAFDQTALEHYADMDRSGYKLFDPLECRDGHLNTSPVGTYRANPFGVYDLIGNVAEWVADCHASSHAALDESGVLATADIACTRRLAKGGSWGSLGHNVRTAERDPYSPAHRDDSIGIRVAKSRP